MAARRPDAELETIEATGHVPPVLGRRGIGRRPVRTGGMATRVRLALGVLAAAPRAGATLGDALLPVVRGHPELLHRIIAAHAAPSERARLRDPAERLAALSSFLDATAYGVGGMIEDDLTYSRGWGFRPPEVVAEVDVWHGALDPLVPIEHALQLAVTLPHCRVFVDLDEGHHFFRRRLPEIQATLLRGGRPPADAAESDARALRPDRPSQ